MYRKNSLIIRQVFLHGLNRHGIDWTSRWETYFYSFLDPIQYLVIHYKNIILLKSLFDALPQTDGALAEGLGACLSNIAIDDFDFFIKYAKKYLGQKQCESLLEGIYAVDMDTDVFQKKYQTRINNPKDPYHREMMIILGRIHPDN